MLNYQANMNSNRFTKPNLMLPVSGTALFIILQIFGDKTILLLRYENTVIHTGEWWRLLSGHFIHLGWTHLILNLAAMWVLLFIFPPVTKPALPLLSILLLAIGTSLGLMIFSPDVEWYVGLSGMLHGLLLMGAIANYRFKHWPSVILLVGITAKLLWEQFYADAHAMELTIGGKVIYDAHLYGAITGAAIITTYILLSQFYQSHKNRSE